MGRTAKLRPSVWQSRPFTCPDGPRRSFKTLNGQDCQTETLSLAVAPIHVPRRGPRRSFKTLNGQDCQTETLSLAIAPIQVPTWAYKAYKA